MDHVILHIPRIKTICLNDIFRKEEESYCEISRIFHYQIMTGEFFKRINELKYYLTNFENFEIISNNKDFILNYIEEFKNEHNENVMKKEIYSCCLTVSCVDRKIKKWNHFGICGWIPKITTKYKVSLKGKSYEEKLLLCHLSDDEKNFKFEQKKKKFDFLAIFFKEEYFYNNQYNIPTEDIFKFKRKYINEIRVKFCNGNFVCPKDKLCNGHKFIFFLEKIFEAMTHAVIDEKVYYRYFLFKNIVKKENEIFSWDFIPAESKDISNLSYSKRLASLN